MNTTYSGKSSFTANELVLRRAAFTDIPFSQEIAEILQVEGVLSALDNQRAAITAFFEARYWMTNRLPMKQGFRQVIELAAGFSPRGIDMTREPAINFVEVDLPEKSDLKSWLVGKLVERVEL